MDDISGIDSQELIVFLRQLCSNDILSQVIFDIFAFFDDVRFIGLWFAVRYVIRRFCIFLEEKRIGLRMKIFKCFVWSRVYIFDEIVGEFILDEDNVQILVDGIVFLGIFIG